MRRLARPEIFLITAAVCFAPQLAFAQAQPPGGATSETGAGNVKKGADAMAEARRRYELGLKLYDDGNYQAARIELERALALAPSYRILYNIGLTYKQLNNYVDALGAFEKYLQEGGAEVAPERRVEVQKAIAELRSRISHVTVTTNVAGAEVSLDGESVGRTPLSTPVAVNPGVRTFTFQARGYLPASKVLTVGSLESPQLNVVLQETEKTLVIERKGNPWTLPTVIGWSATGAALIAGGVVGGLALKAKSDQTNEVNTLGANSADLSHARDKTQNLASAADGLFITGAVLGVASAFFTYKLVKHSSDASASSTGATLDVHVSPFGLGAVGTF